MRTLRLSHSTLRGYVGESLNPETVIDFLSAFAAFVEGRRVLLGRDTRASSPMVRAAAVSALVSAGCEVVDLGVCPTPVVQFHVPRCGAAGGVAITGAHHAAGWNTVMLLGPDGGPLEPAVGEQVLDAYHAAAFVDHDVRGLGRVIENADWAGDYLTALVSFVDAEAIRAARFRVIVDPAGGAGCRLLPPWSQRLGVDLIAVNGEPTPFPAREPEPRPRTARSIASLMRPLGAAAGFVFSSDMGRVSLVTETGEPLSEEISVVLVAAHVLERRRGPVVTNCCTTRALDDLASQHGVPLVKTPVGQAHVIAGMRDEGAVMAGEGSGSAAIADFSAGFDGLLMMTLILEDLALSGRALSERVGACPRYEIVKRGVPCAPREGYRAIERVRAQLLRFHQGPIDETDGLRVDFDDGWVHVRASRTEPRVRVISEARDRTVAERRAEEWIQWMELGG